MDADEVPVAWWRRLIRLFRRRSAALSWPDLTPNELDDDHGKQALRAIVERRRRHDLVRLRELAQLRLVRHRGLSHGETLSGTALPGGAFSAFDERELTLRKIDDIEAQMSRQWWAPAPAPALPVLADEPEMAAAGFALTQPGGEVTQAEVEAELALSNVSRVARPGARGRLPRAVPELDPVLAEAALRWAAGAGTETETILLQALRAPAEPALQAVYLQALLDLYRATQQRDSFEHAWAEFSNATMVSPAWQAAAIESTGAIVPEAELAGDLTALLGRMTASCVPGQSLVLSCARLQRVDFAAAGALLAWLQGARCQLELQALSPLVATFLALVGVDAQARRLPRPA